MTDNPGRVSPEDLEAFADMLRTVPGCVVDGESHGPATNSIEHCDPRLIAFYLWVARRVESATIARCAEVAANRLAFNLAKELSTLPRLYPEGE